MPEAELDAEEKLADQAKALQQRLGLKGDEQALHALGGVPRALERFLLSSALDIDAAEEALRATLAFRAENGLDADGAASPEVISKVAPHWVGAHCGVSASGNAIVWFAFGNLAPRTLLQSITEEEFAAYYLHFMEASAIVQRENNPPACRSSKWAGAIEILDLNGISASQLYPPALLMLSRVLSLGQVHYPDNLRNGKTVFINAPMVFYGAWAMIKKVLHEDTIANIDIISDDGTEQLSKLLGGQAQLDEVKRRAEEAGASYKPPCSSWFGGWGEEGGEKEKTAN